MRKLDKSLAFWMIVRGTRSYYTKRPIGVSFEVTHSCNCNCLHCDWGGMKPKEKRLSVDDYRRLERKLKPTLLQLSGGEPLLRKDILEIIAAVKERTGLPYLVLVTNGSHLTEDLYLEAGRLGVNQFSISLDFPDERHDKFRRHRGLFQRLSDIVPKLASHGRDDIILNTAITSWNLPYLHQIYEKAKEWGTNVSYSPYTILRVGETEYDIKAPKDLELLKETIDRLVALRRLNGRIVNSDWTLNNMYEFFKNGGIPGCMAGERHMVVNPDGTFRPCSMFDLKFKTRKEMVEKFTKTNECGACYVSIRSYLTQSYRHLLIDNVKERVFKIVPGNGRK